MDITGANAIYQYSLGLPPKEYEKIAMQNPRDLEGWYEKAHQIANIDSRLGVQGHYGNGNQSQSEWDMEVDRLEVIEINAMTKEERERHVRNKLCFICHKSGHRSKECPDRKYKGGSKSGKDKGKYKKKGKQFGNRCHILLQHGTDSYIMIT